MTTYPPEQWNVSAYVGVNVEMQNRTNNPIESYNRRMKQAVGSHPTLPDVVAKVKLEAERHLQLLDHRRAPPPHADPVAVPIPEAYNTAFKLLKRRSGKK
ncbi:hypothetical protein PI124_g12407 [Phytophthora idaei]|nr:hypothetical protein PI125_g19707 [Phytophthora idaei]KAG3135686.1 hypothetical protein PI126_g18138 [Phytophthora idaei]KAG3242773.1 hypothetical protein PI124_g12407 [Phytophthora idaei]